MIERKPFFWEIAFIILLFSVNILAQPTITQQPQPQTVNEGETATFSLSATSVDTLMYQWYKNGSLIPGATASSYTSPATTNSDNGSIFYCMVSDSTASVKSDNVTLTVVAGVAPSISQQPADVSVFEGEIATFTVVASGTEPLQYQWYKNGVIIDGAISSAYTTQATIAQDDESEYYCRVTNAYGDTTSISAKLYVTGPTERVDGGIQVLYNFEETDGDVIHDVSGVNPAEDIKIITPEETAWTPNGLETFYGATTRREATDSKIRSAVVASNEITLEAWVMPEYIPQSTRRIFTFSLSGSIRNFSIVAEGDHYEFRLTTDSTDLNGYPALSSSPGTQTLGLTHLVYTRSNDGTAKIYVNGVLDTTGFIPGSLSRFKDYCYLAIGSEPLGGLDWRGMHYLTAVYSRALSEQEVAHNYSIGASVDKKPAFTIQPQNQYVIEGESLILDSYAVSTLPLTYQWTKNGTAIPGATDRKLTLENVGSLENGNIYRNTATTTAGTTVSSQAVIFVTGIKDRASDGIQALYTFQENGGSIVNDVSGVGSPLNLNVFSTDAVEWTNDGLKINSAPTIVTSNSATKIIQSVKSSNEVTVEAWVATSNINQAAPARIFTISSDANSRNISLGQNNDSYEVSIRTSTSSSNDGTTIGSSSGTVSSSGFDHVVFTRSSDGTAKFYINGTERVSTTLDGNFSNWNDAYLLSLGNEFGIDQHWEGLVNLIAIFDRPLSNSEVLRNYNFGPYGVVYNPTDMTLLSNIVGSIIFSWTDNSSNEEGFIIERGSGNPIAFTQIGTLGADSTTFNDTNLVDNTVYYYRVKAYNSLGESQYSDTLVVQSLITPLSAPNNLAYTLDSDGYPIITWTDNTEKETNFEIVRRTTGAGAEYSAIDTVESNVNSYKDLSVNANTTYVYKIKAFNQDTSSTYSEELYVEVLTAVDGIEKIPTEYSLSQNYPNPFNPSTTIKFGLPESANVKIILYNILGQQISTLVSKDFSAGIHSINFNAENLTSGLYIYSIVAKGVNGKNFSATKKMVLLK